MRSFVKQCLARLDYAVDKRTLSPEEFVASLKELGFERGATVMVHSSMRRIRRRVPSLTPQTLIALMQELLGPRGTMLMPTFPFSGKQAVYVDNNDYFDAQSAPSLVGVLTETFRRTPGVIRSLHPTHPVAGWGLHAQEILDAHHQGTTFGVNSPFYKLREFNGRVIGLGTRLQNAFTILHVPEELDPTARRLAFEENTRRMRIVNGADEFVYELHVMRTGVTREYKKVEAILLAEGILRYRSFRGLQCAVTNAGAYIDRCLRLAAENNYLLCASNETEHFPAPTTS